MLDAPFFGSNVLLSCLVTQKIQKQFALALEYYRNLKRINKNSKTFTKKELNLLTIFSTLGFEYNCNTWNLYIKIHNPGFYWPWHCHSDHCIDLKSLSSN